MNKTRHAAVNMFSYDGHSATVLSVHETRQAADEAVEAHNEQYPDMLPNVTHDGRAAFPVVVEAGARVGDRVKADGWQFSVCATAHPRTQ